MIRRVPFAAVAMLLTGVPGLALTPAPPCEMTVEAAMTVYYMLPLGGYEVQSGAVVEAYGNARTTDGAVYVNRPAPTRELEDFTGVRVTFCPTGDFLAIRGQNVDAVSTSLAATEFLRADVQANRRVSFAKLRRASRAVYVDVMVLRETEQTCGCAAYFPAMKPDGMTAFDDRTDIDR